MTKKSALSHVCSLSGKPYGLIGILRPIHADQNLGFSGNASYSPQDFGWALVD